MRFLLLIAMGWALGAQAQPQTQLEMWEEPSHALVLHNDDARLIDINVLPGATTELHRHRFATVYLVIQDARTASQLDGDVEVERTDQDYRAPGSLVDRVDYVAQPLYHRVTNKDERTLHLVAVVNERNPAAVVINTADSKLLNNAWFAEQRLRLGPNELSKTLQFEHDAVLLQHDQGQSHIWENETRHSFKSEAGAFSWHPAGSEFRVANGLPTAREFVLILVKR